MPDPITREQLRGLLLDWQGGKLDERQVHEEAERLGEIHGMKELPETDPESIPQEVLLQLDILNHQLITPDDIPEMLRFLDTAAGDERAAWKRWREYWDAVDLDKRRRALAGNPYYMT